MSDSKLTPVAVYRGVLLAFGLVVAGLIFKQLITLVLAVLIVVIVSLPLEAFATRLERLRIPRAISVLLGVLIGIAAVTLLLVEIIPVFQREIQQFIDSLPGIVDTLRHRLGQLTGSSPSHAGQQIQHFVNSYTHHPSKLLGPIASIGTNVAAAIGAIIVVLLTAVYTAIRPEPLVSGFVRVFPPAHRAQVSRVLDRLRTAYLGWLRGLVLGMVILGVITYLGLRLVGLQYAAFFAVLTAVAMIIPYFGALASSIPPILFALTISPGKAVLVTVIYIVAHQVEGNMIQPLVMARTVELHPAVVAVGVVAVDRLFGFVGLIVAVPILGTVRVLVEELWIKPVEQRNLTLAKPGDVAAAAEAVVAEPTPLVGRGKDGR